MAKITVFVSLAVFCIAISTSAAQLKRVCYFTNWAQFRKDDGSYKPENIDGSLCSHIIFAFASMEGNQVIAGQEGDDGPGGMYEKVNAHKDSNPDLKTLIAVGGGSFGMGKPSAMMSSDGSRREFIDSAIKFAKDRNFNGVDLDFEFPGTGDSPPDDKHRFTQLVQEMKTSFEAEGLILSAAVAAGKWTIDSGYEMGDVCGALDFVNLMAYDFHGPWDEEPKAGFNAPLFAGDGFAEELNVDYAARYWADGGCARDKLVIGMATYGRGFTLANEAENGPGAATTGPSSAGPFTGEEGILAYYEICDMKTEIKFDDKQKVPYTNAGNQWVGFDNEQSLTEKVKYVKDGGFAGWMTWTLDMDDFTGNHCGAGPYPLHKALNAAS